MYWPHLKMFYIIGGFAVNFDEFLLIEELGDFTP